MTDQPCPKDALKWHRRNSPDIVIDHVSKCMELSDPERWELMFYMLAHQANAIGMMGSQLGLEMDEMSETRDN